MESKLVWGRLATLDRVKSFNTTQLVLDALGDGAGKTDDFTALNNNAAAKASGYMQQILQQWQASQKLPKSSANLSV